MAKARTTPAIPKFNKKLNARQTSTTNATKKKVRTAERRLLAVTWS